MKGSRVPSIPGRPKVKVVGKEVTLTWTRPDSGGVEVTGYCIVYTTVDSCMAKYITVKTTTTAKLSNKLIPGQSYVFAVAAKNAFHFGDFSQFSEEVRIASNTGNNLYSCCANFLFGSRFL